MGPRQRVQGQEAGVKDWKQKKREKKQVKAKAG
jgi:hypothetical protein